MLYYFHKQKKGGVEMGIIFNGNVTINGNVEMYDNGSMKITTVNEISIPVGELRQFIEENLVDSVNKQDYLDAAEVLKGSTETTDIQNAMSKMKNLAGELGKNVLILGLSKAVAEVIKNALL